jgi:hypothetical protein
VKEVTRFETTDGQLFETAIDATNHETQISISRRVDAYITGISAQPPASTRLRNDLTRFMNWELDQIKKDVQKVVDEIRSEPTSKELTEKKAA